MCDFTIMLKILKNISFYLTLLMIYSSILISQDCDVCQFTIEEKQFNDQIVGYYLGGFDPSTGDSDVFLFEYEISGPPECYYNSSDEVVNVEFSINIFSPAMGFNAPTEFLDVNLILTDFTQTVRIKNTDINMGTTTVDGANLEMSKPVVHVSNSDIDQMANYILNQILCYLFFVIYFLLQ